MAHERQASRRQGGGKGAGHLHEGANAASIRRRRLSHPPREEGAETPQARKADFHTDICHRIGPGGKEVLCGVQADLDAKLVWRDAEDGLELADEMEWRDLHLAREVRYGRRGIALLSQQVARQTQASEPFVSQQHRW